MLPDLTDADKARARELSLSRTDGGEFMITQLMRVLYAVWALTTTANAQSAELTALRNSIATIQQGVKSINEQLLTNEKKIILEAIRIQGCIHGWSTVTWESVASVTANRFGRQIGEEKGRRGWFTKAVRRIKASVHANLQDTHEIQRLTISDFVKYILYINRITFDGHDRRRVACLVSALLILVVCVSHSFLTRVYFLATLYLTARIPAGDRRVLVQF